MLPDDYDLSEEDMEELARMTAEVNETSAGWFQRYGFEHKCRCDMDAAEGNMEHVPNCWANAADDAFNQCAFYRGALTFIASGSADDPASFAETVVTRDHLGEFKARAGADGDE